MRNKTIVLMLLGCIIVAGVYFGFANTPKRLLEEGIKAVTSYKVGESPNDGVFYNNYLYSFNSYTAQELIFDRINLEDQTNELVKFEYPMELGRLNTVIPPNMSIFEDSIYIMLHYQQMVLIYDREGHLQNHWQVPVITQTSELAVGSEGIYLLVPQKRIVLILDSEGNEKGRFPVEKGSVRLVIKDNIYVGNALGTIVSYSAIGEEISREELDIRFMYSFTLNEQRIYAAYIDSEGFNRLRVFRRDGKKSKTYDLPYIITGLQQNQDKLYISDENRQEIVVYKLK